MRRSPEVALTAPGRNVDLHPSEGGAQRPRHGTRQRPEPRLDRLAGVEPEDPVDVAGRPASLWGVRDGLIARRSRFRPAAHGPHHGRAERRPQPATRADGGPALPAAEPSPPSEAASATAPSAATPRIRRHLIRFPRISEKHLRCTSRSARVLAGPSFCLQNLNSAGGHGPGSFCTSPSDDFGAWSNN